MKRSPIVLSIAMLLCLAVSVMAQGVIDLPQTGQTRCYDTAGTEIACTGTGQDGDIRAGVDWPSPRFTSGVGAESECMIDNLTGLMWPKNANLPGGTSTWYDAIDYANNLTLCGHSDWQLPNVNELESLINADVPNAATWLTSQGFSNAESIFYHWSSTNGSTDYAWIVSMWYGYGGANKGDQGFSVWAVRATTSGPAQVWKTGQTVSYRSGDDGDVERGVSWPNPRFSDHSNGTVTDNLTGLVWTKDANAPGPSSCGPGTSKTWQGALDHVTCLNTQNYLDHSDWRLPNRKELTSLIDRSRYNPALPSGHPFDNVQSGSYYWSSTTHADYTGGAWDVLMWGGHVGAASKGYDGYYVWAVRAGGSSIISPLIAMSPMSGPPGTTFTEWGTGFTPNGTATLHFRKPDGTEYPVLQRQLDGTGHFEIPYMAPMNKPPGTYTWWAIDDTTRLKSNEVSYTIEGTAVDAFTISGRVVDGQGIRMVGTPVFLTQNGSIIAQTITDGDGVYRFTGLAAGSYVIYAESGYGKSIEQPIEVGGAYQETTLTVSVSLCTHALTPILLVPGITGSSIGGGGVYPFLPKDPPAWDSTAWNTGSHGLHDPLRKAGWRDLRDDLDTKGYEYGCNLFFVPYDWRMTLDSTAGTNAVDQYLVKWIERAKAKSGMAKVNVIAHSMGGLLVRSYIESSQYGHDIDKFAMVGTPNKGAPIAYYLWGGGDTVTADSLGGLFSELGLKYYTRTLGLQYANYYKTPYIDEWIDPITAALQRTRFYDIVRTHAPTVRQILPTDRSFLDPTGLGCQSNHWLEGLNAASKASGKIGGDDNHGGKVWARLYTGHGEDTVEKIYTDPPKDGCSSKRYQDGIPDYAKKTREGDGTVPARNVLLDATLGLRIPESTSAAHSGLIGAFRDELVIFMTGSAPDRSARINAEGDPLHVVTLAFTGAARPYVTDPAGRSTGVNPATGIMEYGIPDADMLTHGDGGHITIPDAIDGTYAVSVLDTYAEDYQLTFSYLDGTTSQNTTLWSFSDGYVRTYSFTVNAAAEERITIALTPAPPTGLATVAIPSEEWYTTELTWEASTEPGVTGYTVYTKEEGTQRLAYLGTTTSTSYETGLPWARDGITVPRVFAVSAVKGGTESFLAGPVMNNDRDHDGLTDSEEAALGTNPDNADSDGDGLPDGEEVLRGTNGTIRDSDGDTYSDKDEKDAGSDPLNPLSTPIYRLFVIEAQKAGSGTGAVTSEPAGIACGETCSRTYFTGTPVTLTATPSDTSVFTGWENCPSPSGTTCTLTVSANRIVTASFTAVPPPHTISTSVIKGQGTITCTPSPVPHGQSTTCTITPDAGYSLIALTDNGVPVDIAQLPTNARTLLVSSDRAAWSEIPSPLSHPVGLAAKKDRVILAGADGMARSPDGITWTGVDQDISLTTVYADATRFLAATSDGKILISPDGITWEAVVDVPVPLVRITGGKGTYVAVGAKGTILTSPDGITWTTQNAPTGASLTGIVYGNGTFLAMTENSMLLTSYDGIVWTSHDAPAPGLSSLAYEKGVFTVTAADGRSFRSSTAVNWTSSDDRIPPASPYILTNITPVPAGYGAIGILTNGILSTGYTIPSVTTDHTLTVSFARDLTNAEFITQQYRDFLNRDPDEQGLSAWVGVLTSGQMTRAQVVESFLTSSEFGGVIAPLVRLYFAYFLRVPDYEGLLYWIGQRQVGLPLNDISSAFASSQEFIDTYGSLSPDAFITLVYHNVLGRDPDPSGFSYWLDELTSNRMTRGQIMAGFSESPEYQALMGHEVLSTMMYVGLLRRSPEPGGFTAWVGYLDAGNPATAMIDGFLTSAEYRGRF